MRHTIKTISIILGAQLLFAAGVVTQPAIKKYFTTGQEMAENKGYDTQALARLSDASSFIDMPVKPRGKYDR